MPDERSRMTVAQAMADKIGPEVAAALMECVPPFAWPEIATKADISHLRADFDRLERTMRNEFATKSDLGAVRSDVGAVRSELGTVKYELLAAIEAQGSRTLRWTVGTMLATLATLGGATAGIAALIR
jgi:hypothetical protein